MQPRVPSVLRARLWLSACLLLLVPTFAQAQVNQFNFTRIAEASNFLSAPAIDAGRVAFWGMGPDSVPGIYTGPIDGPFTLVVNNSTPVPGSTAPLSLIGPEFGFDNGRVAFTGFNDEVRGVYEYVNGAINLIANTNSAIPSAGRNFDLFSYPPSVESGRVAFIGQSATTSGVQPLRGVYLDAGGALSRIVDTTMLVPGQSETFSTFYSPVIHGSRSAFIADWQGNKGIFLHDLDTGVLSRVADGDTEIPGRGENFGGFATAGRGLDMDGDLVAFVGRAATIDGVYLFDAVSGEITTIAESGTQVPDGGPAEFEQHFNSVSVDGGGVAFGYGTGFLHTPPVTGPSETPFYGVYSNLGGALAKVVDKGDTLDGKVVLRAHVGPNGLDGDQIATLVQFVDGSDAVYIATPIPEPATLALILTAGCLSVIMAHRARQRRNGGRRSLNPDH